MDTVSRLIVCALLGLLACVGEASAYGLVTAGTTSQTAWCTRANEAGGGCSNASEYLAAGGAQGACQRRLAAFNAGASPGFAYTMTSWTATGCFLASTYNGNPGTNYSLSTSTQSKQIPNCPANATRNAAETACVCNGGFKGGAFGGVSAAGSCTPYSCTPGAGPTMSSSSRSGADGYACDSDGAQSGCVLSKEFYAGTRPDGGAYVYWSSSKYTGATCQENGTSSASAGTAPPEAAEPHTPTNDEKCVFGNNPPMCPGVVNGTSVCVVCGGSSKTTTETSATPAGAGSAPAGVQAGTKSTSTECSGTSCTTTTTYKDAGGTVIGTTTSSGPPSGSSFGSGGGTGTGDTLCDVYPNVAACKTGSFAGTCAAGAASIACEGDAVQCSIAREQFKRQCEFFEKTGDETTAANQAKTDGIAGASDHPNRSPETHSLSTFDQTNLIGGSCPPDRVLGSGSVHVTLPFSQLCGPASTLGMILVGITALSCIAIVFKGS